MLFNRFVFELGKLRDRLHKRKLIYLLLFAGVAKLETGKWATLRRENLAALGDRTLTAIKEKYGYITKAADKTDAATFNAGGGVQMGLMLHINMILPMKVENS